MELNPQKPVEGTTVDCDTAYIMAGRTPIAATASMSFETEEGNEITDLLDGNVTDFLGRVKPSGSFAIAINSPDARTLQGYHYNRARFTMVGVYPEKAGLRGVRAKFSKIDSFGDDTVESGGSELLLEGEFSGQDVEPL